MSASKRLDRIQTNIGKHRKNVIHVLEEMQKKYSPALPDKEKAKLLDQFMFVKSHMDKEHQNALLQRHR